MASLQGEETARTMCISSSATFMDNSRADNAEPMVDKLLTAGCTQLCSVAC